MKLDLPNFHYTVKILSRGKRFLGVVEMKNPVYTYIK